MDRRGRRGPDKKSAEGKFENRLWRHAVPMPLRNVCSACSTPFISNFDPNVTLPSWRNKWVGFHCAAIFRQTLIQSVERRAT